VKVCPNYNGSGHACEDHPRWPWGAASAAMSTRRGSRAPLSWRTMSLLDPE
jgi:hypothetical protein